MQPKIGRLAPTTITTTGSSVSSNVNTTSAVVICSDFASHFQLQVSPNPTASGSGLLWFLPKNETTFEPVIDPETLEQHILDLSQITTIPILNAWIDKLAITSSDITVESNIKMVLHQGVMA